MIKKLQFQKKLFSCCFYYHSFICTHPFEVGMIILNNILLLSLSCKREYQPLLFRLCLPNIPASTQRAETTVLLMFVDCTLKNINKNKKKKFWSITIKKVESSFQNHMLGKNLKICGMDLWVWFFTIRQQNVYILNIFAIVLFRQKFQLVPIKSPQTFTKTVHHLLSISSQISSIASPLKKNINLPI